MKEIIFVIYLFLNKRGLWNQFVCFAEKKGIEKIEQEFEQAINE